MKNLRTRAYQKEANFFPLLWNQLFADDFYTKAKIQNFAANTKQKNATFNIRNEKDHYIIETIAVGFQKSDFNIAYNDSQLTISAKEKEDEKNYTYQGFGKSFTNQTFTIKEQDIDVENITANYEAGILYVKLPKQEKEITKHTINVI